LTSCRLTYTFLFRIAFLEVVNDSNHTCNNGQQQQSQQEAETDVIKAYFVHRHLLIPRVAEGRQISETELANTRIPLCPTCDGCLWLRSTIPEFSIAAGYDFGAPWALGGELPELSLAEQKLIALNI